MGRQRYVNLEYQKEEDEYALEDEEKKNAAVAAVAVDELYS